MYKTFFIHRFRILPLCFFVFLHLSSFAQKAWKLEVVGNVKDEDSKEVVQGAKIEIMKGGSIYKTVYADDNGRFSYTLDPDNSYTVKVSIGNYVSKIITISTENTPGDDEVKENFKANTEFRIFKKVADIDYSVLDNPIGSIFFNAEEKRFDYNVIDFDLKKKLEELKKEMERKKAEQEAKDKADKEAALKRAAFTKDSLAKADADAKKKVQMEEEAARQKAAADAKSDADAKKKAVADAEEAKKKAAAEALAIKEEEKKRAAAAEEAAKAEAKRKADQEAQEKAEAKRKAEQEELDKIAAKKKAENDALELAAAKKKAEFDEAERAKAEKKRAEQAALEQAALEKKAEFEALEKAKADKKIAEQAALEKAAAIKKAEFEEIAKAKAEKQKAQDLEQQKMAEVRKAEMQKKQEAPPTPKVTQYVPPPPVRVAPPVKPIESAPPEIIQPDDVRYDEFDYGTYHVNRVFITVAGVETEYQKIKHQWGGIFYKRDGKDITDGTYKKELRKYGLKAI